MKRAIVLLLGILLFSQSNFALAVPEAPTLSVTTSGINVIASWTTVAGATGYTLYYTPYPYEEGQTIYNADMGSSTDYFVILWEGASYYIAVTSNDGSVSGESGYSNIERVIIDGPVLVECDANNLYRCTTSSTCYNAGGYWWIDNTCNIESEAIVAPVLSVTTSGLDVSLFWTSVPGATGYTLYYAPYSATEESIYDSAAMGTATDYSVTLWDGAAYSVSITASKGSSESESSNVETITVSTPRECDDDNLDICCTRNGGYWWSNNTCNNSAEPASCDNSNLILCTSSTACSDVSGYWWTDNTCNSGAEPASCDNNNLNLCTSSNTCSGASGYWWTDNTCQYTPISNGSVGG